jgi:hypothetical protein
MKQTFQTLLLSLLVLAFFVSAKAQGNENQTVIMQTQDGILVVSNNGDVSFAIEFKGKDFKPLEHQNIMFTVDGRVVQFVQVANSEFAKPATKTPIDQELLIMHKDWEGKYLNDSLKSNAVVKFENAILTGNRAALFWEYPMPAKENQQVISQLFLTTVVGKSLAVLNVVLEKADTKQAARDYMTKSLSSLKTSPKPFDLNAISARIRSGKTPF